MENPFGFIYDFGICLGIDFGFEHFQHLNLRHSGDVDGYCNVDIENVSS